MATALAISLLLGSGGACSRGDEVSRVRERISQGVELAEHRDLANLLAMATDGFRADPGARDRADTAEALGAAFYYYRSFRLLYPLPAVNVEDGAAAAEAAFPFLVVRRDSDFPGLSDLASDPATWLARVGEHADLYHLELDLVKRDGAWLVRAARLRGDRGNVRGGR